MPEAKQSEQYLNMAISTAESVHQFSAKIVDLKEKIAELEEKHGIKALKRQCSDLKKECDALVYATINRAPAALQGSLFEE